MGKYQQRKTAVGLAIAALFASTSAIGQPVGAQPIHGTATLSQQGGNLVVTTTNGAGTNHSAINWQGFSIPTGTSTQFVQPSTTSLSINRVVGGTSSLIDGTLTSNGKLVLVNPAGIAFGKGAVVDTAGFTASTLSMTDADAISGVLRFSNGGNAQAIQVEGRILAREGDVFLIAPTVQVKEGAVIQGPNGATVLAAGQLVQITGRGLEGIVMEVQAPTDEAVNLGRMEAGAVGMFAGTLRHSGDIRAVSATSEGGKVVLRATQTATMDGRIDASAAGQGDGGNVRVWSDGTARVAGGISARGGDQGGDGGFVETSGKQSLTIDGATRIDVGAPQGQAGTWLIDPTTWTLAAGTNLGAADTLYQADIEGGLLTSSGTVLVQADEQINSTGGFTLNLPAGVSLSLVAPTIDLQNLSVTATDTATQGAISMSASQAIHLKGGMYQTQGGAISINSTGPVKLDQTLLYTQTGPIQVTGHSSDPSSPGVSIIGGSSASEVFGFYTTSGHVTIDGTSDDDGMPGLQISQSVALFSGGGATFEFIGRNVVAGGEGIRVIDSVDGMKTFETFSNPNVTVIFQTDRYESVQSETPLLSAPKVILAPLTNQLFSIGGTMGAGMSYVSSDVLNRISATTLTLGDTWLTGGLHIAGPLTPNATTLSLLQGAQGSITQAASITVPALRVQAGTVLLGLNNAVDRLAGEVATELSFANTRNLEIANIDGVNGLYAGYDPGTGTGTGQVTLWPAPSYTLVQSAPIVAGTLKVPQAGAVFLTDTGNYFTRIELGASITAASIYNGSTGDSTLALSEGATFSGLAYHTPGNGTIEAAAFTSSELTLESTTGDVRLTGTVQADTLSVSAQGAIELEGVASLTSGGTVTVSQLTSATQGITLHATSPLDLTAGASATNGSIDITSTGPIGVGGDLVAGQDLTLSGTALSFKAAGTQAINAPGLVSLTAGSLSVGDGELPVTPTTLVISAGSTTINANVGVGQGSALQLDAAGSSATATLSSLSLHGGNLQGSANITVTGDMDISQPASGPQGNQVTGAAGTVLTLQGTTTLSTAMEITTRTVSNEGQLNVNGEMRVHSQLDNLGGVDVSAGNLLWIERMTNAATTGTVRLVGDLRIDNRLDNDGTITLTGADGNIRMSGGVLGGPGPDPLAVLSNNATGVIRLEGTGAIRPNDSLSGNYGSLENSGLILKTNDAGTSNIELAQMQSSGVIRVETGTLALRSGMMPSSAGTLNLASGATLQISNSNLVNDGTLTGAGTLSLGSGILTNNGTVTPGGDGTIAVSPLTVSAGEVVNTSSAILKFDIDGDAYEQLVISGGTATYDTNTRVYINALSAPTLTSYTLQVGDAGGALPQLLGAPSGGSLAFGSLVLNVPPPPPPPPLASPGPVLAVPAPAPPPSALPLDPTGQTTNYLGQTPGTGGGLTTIGGEEGGGGIEDVVVDNGFMCTP